jgi:hypothetical protein
MGILTSMFYPWSLILQVIAIVHYYRRRPAQYWVFVIIFLGPLGALIYLIVEAGPDIMAFTGSVTGMPRQKRITQLEGMIRDNPSAGNFEELGDVYLDAGDFQSARTAFDKAIAARSDTADCFYHRAICALKLGDPASAVTDLEVVLEKEPDHDFHRAAGLLAHVYALSGQMEKAEAQFRVAIARSTLSETYLNYSDFLASEGRYPEAREWAQKVLDKQQTMPGYLQRRERPWFQRAGEALRKLSAPQAAAR